MGDGYIDDIKAYWDGLKQHSLEQPSPFQEVPTEVSDHTEAEGGKIDLMKPYTVKFAQHMLTDVPGEDPEDAGERAWKWMKEHGYVDLIEQAADRTL